MNIMKNDKRLRNLASPALNLAITCKQYINRFHQNSRTIRNMHLPRNLELQIIYFNNY